MRQNKLLVPLFSAAMLGMCVGCGVQAPIVQSFSGSCSSLPNPADLVHQGYPTGYGVLIFGLGRMDTADCVHGAAEVEIFNGTGVPVDTGTPVLQGGGHLSTLNVSSNASGSTAQSGRIVIYINGVPSTLTCTLGTNMRCADTTHSPAVKDDDMIAATIQLSPGDEVTGLQVTFNKQ
jgi:hypothetical protein